MPPFPGALPPELTGGPPGAGPAVAPHGNPGMATQGAGDIKIALDALQKALPTVPMGTELHEAVLKAITNIGKHMTEAANSPQQKIQNLLQMVQQARAKAPNAALAGMAAPSGPQGPPPPMPPALTPPPASPGAAMAA